MKHSRTSFFETRWYCYIFKPQLIVVGISLRLPSSFSFDSTRPNSNSGTCHWSNETFQDVHRHKLSSTCLFCGSSWGTCSWRSVVCRRVDICRSLASSSEIGPREDDWASFAWYHLTWSHAIGDRNCRWSRLQLQEIAAASLWGPEEDVEFPESLTWLSIMAHCVVV